MRLWPFGRKKEAADVPCEEQPIPTHLKTFFVPKPDARNTTQITGDIQCTCGCWAFAAHRQADSTVLYHLTCSECGKDVLLFDERKHGWDTVVCHMHQDDEQTGDITEACNKCGSGRFKATVWIEPTEKEEFVSCVEGELPDDEWVNAFTWFAAHLVCTDCGCMQRGWADVETA